MKKNYPRKRRKNDAAEKRLRKSKRRKGHPVLVAFVVNVFFAALRLIRSLGSANGAGVRIAISLTIYTKRLECFRIL